MDYQSLEGNYSDELSTNTSTDNVSTLSCSERRLLGGPLPISRTAFDVFRYLQIIIFTLGFPIGIILNSMVIVLVAKFKSLHQTTFYLALQVVIVDLCITLLQFPTTTANVIADRWVFGAAGCPSIGFFLFTFRNMRNFLMFVFVTDRLLTVFIPYWYFKQNHRQYIVVPLSILAWIFALIYGIIPIILDCHDYGRIAWGCTINKGCTYPKVCEAYKITSVVLSNVVGGFIPLVMYVVLYCKARQLRKKLPTYRTRQYTIQAALSHFKTDLRSLTNSTTPSEAAGKRKQSVVSENSASDSSSDSTFVVQRRRKNEQKVTVTFLILFIALVGVSFPSTFFFIIGQSAFAAFGIRPPAEFIIVTIIFRTLFNFLVIIDPIAIMRNRDVRIALRESYMICKYRITKQAKPVEATNYIGGQSRDTVSDLFERRMSLNSYMDISRRMSIDNHSQTRRPSNDEGDETAAKLATKSYPTGRRVSIDNHTTVYTINEIA